MPYSPLPLETVNLAIACDSDALVQVLKHYDAYINRLAQRPILATNGAVYLCPDEDTKQELVLELLMKIPRFRIPGEPG